MTTDSTPAGAGTSVRERNRDLVVEAWAAVQSDDWELFERRFDERYRRNTPRGSYTRDGFRALLEASHRAFVTESFELSDLVADEVRVAFRWELVAVHRGEYLGVPPSQRRVTVSGVTISRMRDEVIVEDWASWDRLGFLTALGIIPLDEF